MLTKKLLIVGFLGRWVSSREVHHRHEVRARCHQASGVGISGRVAVSCVSNGMSGFRYIRYIELIV